MLLLMPFLLQTGLRVRAAPALEIRALALIDRGEQTAEEQTAEEQDAGGHQRSGNRLPPHPLEAALPEADRARLDGFAGQEPPQVLPHRCPRAAALARS